MHEKPHTQAWLHTYLDIVRVFACMAVFFLHASAQPISNGLLWQLGGFGEDAVIVFFVLSGYVITHVTHQRETRLADYLCARLARIWSVLLPSLVLGLILYAIRISMGAEHGPISNQIWPTLNSAVFLNYIWDLRQIPADNGPIWSISFEMFYYVCYGLLFFLRTWKKYLAVLLLALLFGPKFLILAPMWIAGVIAYHLTQSRTSLRYAFLLLLSSFAALLWYSQWLEPYLFWNIKRTFFMQDAFFGYGKLAAEYVLAVIVAANIVFFRFFAETLRWPPPRWLQALAAYLASFTLSIYLYHIPFLLLFRDLLDGTSGKLVNGLAMMALALAASAALAPITEWRKGELRRVLRRVLA